MRRVSPSLRARQEVSRLDQRIAHLARIGLLTLAVGLPIVFGGAPTLASAGATVTARLARLAQPGQIQSVKPHGYCPTALSPC